MIRALGRARALVSGEPQVIQGKLLFGRGASLDLAQDGRGRLGHTTAAGLYVSHGGFTREPSVPVHAFWPIHIDGDGALRLGGSGKGLVRFAPDDVHPPRLDAVEALFDEAQAVTTIRWRATDFWSVTPANSLRYRWRIDDGPWSATTNDQEADERGDILYVSLRFLEDFSPHSLGAMHSDPTRLLARIHPDDAEAAAEYLRTQGQRGTRAGELRVQRMDGSYRWLLVTTARRERTEATVAGWDFVGADITDVKRAQEEHTLMERQIRHTQKLERLESLGVLAGGIAHDFNNVLGTET